MIVTGLTEVVTDLAVKSERIYGEGMRIYWDAADRGAAIARARVRKRSGDTAESITPSTYGRRYLPEGHIRSVWGPTTRAGFYLENGTSKMGPFPYLGPSLEAVAGGAVSQLQQKAGEVFD